MKVYFYNWEKIKLIILFKWISCGSGVVLCFIELRLKYLVIVFVMC